MKTIEEIAFTVNGQKCTYKLYEYTEPAMRKIKVPVEIGETTLNMGYNIETINKLQAPTI